MELVNSTRGGHSTTPTGGDSCHVTQGPGGSRTKVDMRAKPRTEDLGGSFTEEVLTALSYLCSLIY